jgi:hypothetical protein
MKYGKTHAERELMKSNEEVAEQKINKLLKQGIKTERKRIIKLLKKWGEDNERCYCCNNDVAAYDLIALIKGENK